MQSQLSIPKSKKFKPGDWVCWRYSANGEKYYEKVVSIKDFIAYLKTTSQDPNYVIETILNQAKVRDTIPIFITSCKYFGWMPENKLHPVTKAELILFGYDKGNFSK